METNEQHFEEQRRGEDRRVGGDRRSSQDRRSGDGGEGCYTGPERRHNVIDRRLGLDRRRGPGKRRGDDRRSAEEGQMSDEQFEFLMAIDEYKKKNARPFPTWTEVLEIIKALGYRKVAEPSALAECSKEAENR